LESFAIAEGRARKESPDVEPDGELHRHHRRSLPCDELGVMLIYSMGVSVDGFIADREGAFGWGAPSDELFRFHLDQVRGLGSFLLGRRLYETMLVWETDPSLRDNEDTDAFADVWGALPKVVFSRTLESVQGNARLAEAPLAEEVAAALDATDKDVGIGGAGLAAAAIELGLVDELRPFRYPVVVGGGTPFLPPVTEDIALELIETRTFGSRVIYERYRRARDDSD
jgi:dihydrofolate reductase